MRAKWLGLIGLVGGGAAWVLRDTGAVRQVQGRLAEGPLGALVGTSKGGGENEPESLERARHLDDVQDQVAENVREGEDLEVVADDPGSLVEAERELLTVEGEEGEAHRRRDQTAGVAAQEIAAAQVRERRNGEQVP